MTETAFYILISFLYNRHGYETIKYVERITNNRLSIGAGTIYSTISKFERDGLIACVDRDDRRKIYHVTELGKCLLQKEVKRIDEMYEITLKIKELIGSENKNEKVALMGTVVVQENGSMA